MAYIWTGNVRELKNTIERGGPDRKGTGIKAKDLGIEDRHEAETPKQAEVNRISPHFQVQVSIFPPFRNPWKSIILKKP